MLTNPEARRGLRAIVQAISGLAVLIVLAMIVVSLKGEPNALEHVALSLISILAIAELLYGAENVTRAIKLKVGPDGIDSEIGADVAGGVA
jgi:hypothetical protein